MKIDLQGKKAFITGSTQGVGAAIAIALAQAGATVILHGLREDAESEATLKRCRELSPESTIICFDLSASISEIQSHLFKPLIESHPDTSIFVSNAGIYIDPPFLKGDEVNFDRTMHINVKVGYFLTQWFATNWIENQRHGKVLFTGSINGLLAEADHTAYDTSKGALSAMVRSLCVALAPYDIRVNAIAPGLIRTPLTNQVLSNDPTALDWMRLHTPNGQVPEASVCGPIAAFLVSDLAAHMHGQTVYIDGGMNAWQQPDVPPEYRRWHQANAKESHHGTS